MPISGRPMIPVSPDGWRVGKGLTAAATTICISTALVGALLTLSWFFTLIGIPVLALASLGVHTSRRASEPGALHPAFGLALLAAFEFLLTVAALLNLPDQRVGLGLLGVAGLTGLIGALLIKATRPAPPPPPPRREHVPSTRCT